MSTESINDYAETKLILTSLSKSIIPKHASFVYHHVHTITQTDYVYSTIAIPTQGLEAQPTSLSPIDSAISPIDDDGWEQHVLPFLPAILAFAIIGLLALVGCVIYSSYRASQVCQAKYQQHQRHRFNSNLNFDRKEKRLISPLSATFSNIIPRLAIPSPRYPTDDQDKELHEQYHPYQSEPIRFDKSDINHLKNNQQDATSSYLKHPSLAFSLLAKLLPSKFTSGSRTAPTQPLRHRSLPIAFASTGTSIDNLNIPISSTFVPIDKSSLTLVPRSEIWLDPHRRRGVDELDIWERKHSSTTPTENQTVVDSEPRSNLPMWRFPSEEAYPDSPESFERRPSIPLDLYAEGSHTHLTLDSVQDIAPSQLLEPHASSLATSSGPSSSCATTVDQAGHKLNLEEIEDGLQFKTPSIKVKLPKSKKKKQKEQAAWEIQMAREALQASLLANSSSQCLSLTRSQSF